MKEKLWKAITSDAAEKRKQDDLEKAEMSGPCDPHNGGVVIQTNGPINLGFAWFIQNEVRHPKCPIYRGIWIFFSQIMIQTGREHPSNGFCWVLPSVENPC